MRNIDPMKKDKKESAFFAKYLSIIDEIEDDQFKNAETVRENMCRMYKGAKEIKFSEESVAEIRSRVDLPSDFCQKQSRNWQLGGAAEWINATPPHEEAIGTVALEREVSGKISLSSDL